MSIRDAAHMLGIKKSFAHLLVSEANALDGQTLGNLRLVEREATVAERRAARRGPVVSGSQQERHRTISDARIAKRIEALRAPIAARRKRRR